MRRGFFGRGGRFKHPLQRAEAAIVERLRRADVIGCNETGARLTTAEQGARMSWEWVLVSDKAVLHRIHRSRGRDVITEVLGQHRPRCWVSDRWGCSKGTPRPIRPAWLTSSGTPSTPSMPASHALRQPCAACCAGPLRLGDDGRL
ncbi:IS66 family transposase [Azospirillum argentinense]|uniref:IS66 family transposase n=1 Tax=Azospirillum argentinense TaxID=2970906 RepID=UPI0032E036BE